MKFVKIVAITLFAVPVLMYRADPVSGATRAVDDPAAEYKAKCAACHTATAAKFYNPAKSDEEHVQTILKGKKGEKPPFMPAFEAKGMTEDAAKALAAYMKSLKSGS